MSKATRSKSQAPDDNDPMWIEQIWSKLEQKMTDWIKNTLPTIVADTVKSISTELIKQQVDQYISSKNFQEGLSASLNFDAAQLQDNIDQLKTEINAAETKISDLADENDRLEQYTRRTNIRIFGIPETDDASTDDLALSLFKDELDLQIDPNNISRSHRIGKRSTKPRPIIVRFTTHNTKVNILRKRRTLKEKKRPFSVQEDLTQPRRDILKYIREYGEGKVTKVWTIDGTICFRATDQSVVERCTTLKLCKQLLDKY